MVGRRDRSKSLTTSLTMTVTQLGLTTAMSLENFYCKFHIKTDEFAKVSCPMQNALSWPTKKIDLKHFRHSNPVSALNPQSYLDF